MPIGLSHVESSSLNKPATKKGAGLGFTAEKVVGMFKTGCCLVISGTLITNDAPCKSKTFGSQQPTDYCGYFLQDS